MYTPSIYTKDFANDFSDLMRGFGDFFAPSRFGFDTSVKGISTDVREFDDHYQFDLELPGYKKEDIKATVKEGYLTVSAKHDEETSEKDEDGKYIRRERVYGQCQRSFYVGKEVTGDMLKASFENGVLKIDVPKVEPKKELPVEETITIE